MAVQDSLLGRKAMAGSNGTGFGLLRDIGAVHRGPILLVYALFNLENGLRLVQPLVLGWAINDLLQSSYQGLAIFIAQHLAYLTTGWLRQMYDTRVFSRIHAGLAAEVVLRQRAGEAKVSQVAARTALSRQFVDFFETQVPKLIRALYSVAGAMLMLAFYDGGLVIFCLVLLIPATLLNLVYGRKTFYWSGRLHDRFEREVEVVDSEEPPEVRQHYQDLARYRIRLSDWRALNFGFMELFVLALLAAALIRICGQPATTPGDILAVFRYVLMFVTGLDALPGLVGQLSRLRDIGLRLRTSPN